MDLELMFTLGCVFVFFAIPACLNGFSESRFPRIGALMLLGGAGATAFAIIENPERFTLEPIPLVFVEVLARFFA